MFPQHSPDRCYPGYMAWCYGPRSDACSGRRSARGVSQHTKRPCSFVTLPPGFPGFALQSPALRRHPQAAGPPAPASAPAAGRPSAWALGLSSSPAHMHGIPGQRLMLHRLLLNAICCVMCTRATRPSYKAATKGMGWQPGSASTAHSHRVPATISMLQSNMPAAACPLRALQSLADMFADMCIIAQEHGCAASQLPIIHANLTPCHTPPSRWPAPPACPTEWRPPSRPGTFA